MIKAPYIKSIFVTLIVFIFGFLCQMFYLKFNNNLKSLTQTENELLDFKLIERQKTTDKIIIDKTILENQNTLFNTIKIKDKKLEDVDFNVLKNKSLLIIPMNVCIDCLKREINLILSNENNNNNIKCILVESNTFNEYLIIANQIDFPNVYYVKFNDFKWPNLQSLWLIKLNNFLTIIKIYPILKNEPIRNANIISSFFSK